MADMMHPDVDPQETQEWLDSLETVFEEEGAERAHFLLEALIDKARRSAYSGCNTLECFNDRVACF